MTPAASHNEVVSFLAACLQGEDDPQPMASEDAAYTMPNRAAEYVEYPAGMTPKLMSSVWNSMIC